MYPLCNDYEKRVLNLKRLLKELIETSDQPLALPINWEVAVCGKFCSRLGGGHGHWLALGWHWYHSDQCYCLGRIAGWVPVSWDSSEDPTVVISLDASQ